MKQVSTKTGNRDRYYSRLREIWMTGSCLARVEGVCTGQAVDTHHKAGRGLTVMLRVETWLPVCSACHRWITENRRDADGRSVYDLGLKLRIGDPMPKKQSYGRCRACSHPIYWVVTENDRSMPLDADPDSEMPLALDPATVPKQGRIQESSAQQTLGGETSTLVVRVLSNDDDLDEGLAVWRSHFATCSGRAK